MHEPMRMQSSIRSCSMAPHAGARFLLARWRLVEVVLDLGPICDTEGVQSILIHDHRSPTLETVLSLSSAWHEPVTLITGPCAKSNVTAPNVACSVGTRTALQTGVGRVDAENRPLCQGGLQPVQMARCLVRLTRDARACDPNLNKWVGRWTRRQV
ncbi:hypothetical protein CLAIMM_00141 [Cladophialophora immunda]|nr:hypothetical protein CLAIMM_00141 [Cladophialophora immunda]